MSENFENKMATPVLAEETKGDCSRIHDESWGIKSAIDHNAIGKSVLAEQTKGADTAILPPVSISANEASKSEIATGHGHHPHHGGYYPEGSAQYQKPESSGQFQTNGGSANFEHLKTGHHGGYYPGSESQPISHPVSSGQFQVNEGHADFERTGHNNAFHHPFGPGGFYPTPTAIHEIPSGSFQINTGIANFERTGHNNAFHHPFGPGGFYPNPFAHEVPAWSKVSASGGDHTIVRSSTKI